MKNTPKIHDAISACDSPPLAPTDRMMATGPVIANSQPMKPCEA